ncbi:MAG TPA: PPK2 family polyphosphate kinase [Methylomirabilota bacterium]|nr:PPK2 family polyphosphate kinase [Methylomirabilota bacterium]
MKAQPFVIQGKIRLADFDPGFCGGMKKEKAKAQTEEYTRRIGELQELLYANSNRAVLLIFQGLDASGKDGSARRVLEHVDPLGVVTANFKVPSPEERAHDFLWRVHKAVPRSGYMGVFNRSYYEAVLVERVLKLAPKKIWLQRYEQIVDFERMLVENNVLLLKFCLHVSKNEQAERLKERLTEPHKLWKFSPSDLTTRQLWNDYAEAYEDMLNATSHKSARWHLVPADRNWYRDFVISRTVVQAMEDLKMKWPKPKEDLSKIRIV